MAMTNGETIEGAGAGRFPEGRRMAHLALLGAVLLIAAGAFAMPLVAVTLLCLGGALLTVAVTLAVSRALEIRRLGAADVALKHVLAEDQVPSVLTGPDGAVLYANPAAGDWPTIADALGPHLADPGLVIRRLLERAAAQGAAGEDLPSRRGRRRLTVKRLTPERFLWRVEAAVREAALDSIGLPMAVVTQTGRVISTNEALRRLLGRNERSLDRIVSDLPIRPGALHRVQAESGPVQVRAIELPAPAGRRELYLAPAPEESGHVLSGRWDLVHSLPVALLKLAPDGTVLFGNRLACDLLGIAEGENPPLSALVEGLGRPLADWLSETAEGRGLPRHEFLRAIRAAQDLHVQMMLTRFVEDGEVAVIAVLNDATELKTLEAQFVQSQKMQAIGQLAGGVAHDFNNLLTAIRGHCDLLLHHRDPGDPDYADLEQINQNTNRAAALVAQLLAFSRKQNLRPELIDLREAMADLTHLLNRLVGETISVNLVHGPEARPIRADRRQLEQVIVNLVVNARDAMPEGGEITIETRLVSLREPLARDRAVVPPGAYKQIRISDQGTGIPPDVLPKIFEPFFTTKRAGEGTGLGLSTVYGIVKQSGGYIFADSEPGSGTTFTLWFPAHEAVPQAPAAAAPRRRSSHGQGVVLLVEDEAAVRAFASRALRLKGYTVLEAASAEAALEMLEDPDLRVDLFVTDVIMPGIDGPAWVAQALRRRPGTRVIFVSGYAEESVAEGQSRIPGSVFLPKPFSLAQLTETVAEQLKT